jgi:hypothetical protein
MIDDRHTADLIGPRHLRSPTLPSFE